MTHTAVVVVLFLATGLASLLFGLTLRGLGLGPVPPSRPKKSASR